MRLVGPDGSGKTRGVRGGRTDRLLESGRSLSPSEAPLELLVRQVGGIGCLLALAIVVIVTSAAHSTRGAAVLAPATQSPGHVPPVG